MSIVESVGAEIPRSWLRPLVYGLSAAGLALGIIVMLTRSPAAVVLLLAAPAPALVLASRAPALFEVRQRGGGRGFSPLVGGGAAGVGLAALGPSLLGLAAPLIGAGVGGLVGIVLAAATVRRTKLAAPIQYVLVLTSLFALYGGAGAILVDDRFDASPPQTFATTITGKQVSHGRETSYLLEVAPWGPQTRPSSVAVRAGLYADVQPGDAICMKLHRGALGSAWYEAAACAPAARPAAPLDPNE